MAQITRASDAKIDGVSAQYAPQIAGDLYAGEALDAVAPCYIETDGTVHMCNGTAANAAAVVRGWTMKAYASGEPVTLFHNVIAKYNEATLTPGDDYYVDTVDGRLNDAATTGGTTVVAYAISDSDVFLKAD